MISFRCPCGKDIKVKEDLAGRKGKCPACGQFIHVPAASRDRTSPDNGANHREIREQDATHFLSSAPPNPEVYDFLAPAENPDELGRLGAYRVLKVLGAGGMGVVFRAEDPGLQRLVALKAMLPSLATSPSAKERFFREARAAAALKHPHIVTIFQVGEDRGAPYLAMEFLEGEPLDQRLHQKARLPVAEILRIGREVAKGLAAAHDKGLIHRDIKPANIWLEGAEAHVKILDFGLARAMADQGHLTQTGAILGTPAYMAPEQASAGVVDHRCDLFSLGCVLYVMCTGELPFKGKDPMSMLMSLALDTPSPPAERNPDVPKKLSDLVMRLLSKKPEERPPSALAVVQAIQDIEANPGVKKTRPTEKTVKIKAAPATRIAAVRKPPRPPKKPLPWIYWIAGGLLGLGVLLAASVVILWPTPHGTVRIESDDPNVEVVFDKTGPTIKGIDAKPLTMRAGEHGILIKRGDFEFEADKFQLKSGATVRLTIEVIRGELRLSRDGKVIAEKALPQPLAKVDPKQPPVEPPKGRSPLDDLTREDIPAVELKNVGLGDPTKTPKELVAVLGDSRFMHWKNVIDLAFSPDGKSIASIGQDSAIRVWDAATGAQRFVRNCTLGAHAVAWSRNGKWLASGHYGTARLWDAQTGMELAELQGQHKHWVNQLAFSPDDKWLATASDDGTVCLWEADTGKHVATFEGHVKPVRCVAVSPDSKRVASGGDDNRVLVWNVSDRKVVHTLAKHTKAVRSVAFRHDGKQIASGSDDATARVWDAQTGAEVCVLDGHKDWVRGVAFQPDTGRLAVREQDGVAVWDVENKKKLHFESTFQNPDFQAGRIAYSPDGKRIAALAYQTLWIWDVAAAKVLNDPSWRVMNGRVSFRPDGKRLAAAGGTRGIFDLPSCRKAEKPEADIPGTPVYGVDGKTLAVEVDAGIWVAEADGSRLRHQLETKYTPARHSVLTFNRDCNLLASGSHEKTVILWDLASGKKQHTLTGHKHHVLTAAFSPDGRRLVTGGGDVVYYGNDGSTEGEVRLWDTATGKETLRLNGHAAPGDVWSVAWSGDGKRIASASADKTVKLWDADTGKVARTFAEHKSAVRCVLFRHDSRTMLSVDGDGVLLEWDGASGKVLRRWQFPGTIAHLALAADGRHLATANFNGTAYILRLEPGSETQLPKKPFVVLARDDRPETPYATLAAAVAAAQSGDTIEIQGNGPFQCEPIIIDNKALALRASIGKRPNLRFAQSGYLIRTNASLILEGLEIVIDKPKDGGAPSAGILIEEPAGEFRALNCQIISVTKIDEQATFLVRSGAVRTSWHNCAVFHGHTVTMFPSVNSEYEVRNCIFGWEPRFILQANWPKNRRVRIMDSTLPNGLLALETQGKPKDAVPELQLNVERSVFGNPLIRFFHGQAGEEKESEQLLRKSIAWNQSANCFATPFLGHVLFDGGHQKLVPPTLIEDIDAWRKFWALDGGGTINGNIMFTADWRLADGSAGKAKGPGGKDLGADVDLVGPGAAYERWKKTPEYAEWRKQTDALMSKAAAEAQAFVILAKDKRAEMRHATLAAAVAAAQSGDTIEIQGNGPFAMAEEIDVKKALTIRAGPGNWPVITFTGRPTSDDGFWLTARAPLTLEGIDFRYDKFDPKGALNVFHNRGPSLRLAHCRIIVRGSCHAVACFGRDVQLEGCQIVTAGWSCITPWFSEPGQLDIKGSILAGYPPVLFENAESTPRTGADLDLKIDRSTLLSTGGNLTWRVQVGLPASVKDPKTKGLRIKSSRNVVDHLGREWGSILTLESRIDSDFIDAKNTLPFLKQRVGWSSEYDLYPPGHFVVRSAVKNLNLEHLGTLLPTLEEWENQWGMKNTKSIQSKAKFEGGDLAAKWRDDPFALVPADFRLAKGSPGQGVLPGGKDLGADVDLVGPGPAYERWKQTPEYQEWRKKTEELMASAAGPFVILGKDKKAESRHPTLAAAVAATQSGDSIEIRGDGPFATPPINLRENALTIRAAEGCRPILRLDASGLGKDNGLTLLTSSAPLTLEGLDLQFLGLKDRPWSNVVDAVGPLRVAHCRLVSDGPGSVIVPWQDAELINTLLRGPVSGLTRELSKQGGLRMVNCLVSAQAPLVLHSGFERIAKVDLQLQQCTLRGDTPVTFQIWDAKTVEGLKGDNPPVHWKSSHTVFSRSSGASYFQNAWYAKAPDPKDAGLDMLRRVFSWQMEKDLISAGHESIYSMMYANPKLRYEFAPTLKSMEDWQKFWDKERISASSGDVRFKGLDNPDINWAEIQPANFRLAKGSPGQGVLPGGKDLGADVDLVGPGPAYERWKKTPAYQEWCRQPTR